MLKGVGCDTSLIPTGNILEGFDREMVDLVVDSMVEKKIRIIKGNGVTCIEKPGPDESLTVSFWTLGCLREEKFDTVLFAVGREAALDALKLNNIGIKTKDNKIEVDQQSMTTTPNVFAVGDCLHGKPELASAAVKAGQQIARNMFSNEKKTISYDNIGRTLLSPLEYAFIGQTEEGANAVYRGDNIEVFHGKFQPAEFLITHRSIRHCFLKAIALKHGAQKIIGLHFMGPNAGEVLQGYAVAVNCGLTIQTLNDSVGIHHPTVSQEFLRLKTTKRSGKNPEEPFCNCN